MEDRERLKGICETFIDEAMELNDLPGLVIGVCRGAEEAVCARGVRDVLAGDPLEPGDVFHCASVSKLFTSSAIMVLVRAGILDLKDRLCQILPEFSVGGETDQGDLSSLPDPSEMGEGLSNGLFSSVSPIVDKRWEDIRLYQMLSHTAGIGDVDDYHWEEALTDEKALENYVHSPEVMNQPLLWAPGSGGFRYSNVAYEILGHIVAEKSADYAGRKLSYEEFIRDYLMEPAGMRDSTMMTCSRFDQAEGAVSERKAGAEDPGEYREEIRTGEGAAEEPRGRGPEGVRRAGLITDEIRRRNAGAGPWHPMALPHEKAQDRTIVPVKYYPYTRSHGPSSTLTSTASDLLKWGRMHMAGFRAVEAADPEEDRPEVRSALGFTEYQHIHYEYAEVPNNHEKMGLGWFMRKQGGYQLYGHEGTDDGFRASFWICPALDLAIVVLSNLSGAPVKKLNRKLFERLTAAGH